MPEAVHVISIGSDRELFNEKSAVRARMASYGSLFSSLHIIVRTGRFSGFVNTQIAPNVFVYPTRTLTRLGSLSKAVKIGNRLAASLVASSGTSIPVVVSGQDPFELGYCAYSIAKKNNAALHLQLHTDPFAPAFARGILNRIRIRIMRGLLPHAHAIRVVSPILKDVLVEKYHLKEERISVLPVYAPMQKFTSMESVPAQHYFQTKYPQFDRVVLVASRLSPEKNIGVAIRAFARVAADFPRTGLCIVGKGKQLWKLRLLVRFLRLSDVVVFAPWQNDLRQMYRDAAIFLQTSRFEGFGLTLLEAGVCGLPVVTTRVGIAHNFVSKTDAYVCAVGDVSCLASSLREVLSDTATQKRLGVSLRKAVARYEISEADYLRQYQAGVLLCFPLLSISREVKEKVQ